MFAKKFISNFIEKFQAAYFFLSYSIFELTRFCVARKKTIEREILNETGYMIIYAYRSIKGGMNKVANNATNTHSRP